MEENNCDLAVGSMYDVKVSVRDPKGEGICRIRDTVVFVKNTRVRLGKTYKVKITKSFKSFAYAELVENSKYFIGNGSLII
jgi:predicted RNA-binding protein with TRAM domain